MLRVTVQCNDCKSYRLSRSVDTITVQCYQRIGKIRYALNVTTEQILHYRIVVINK